MSARVVRNIGFFVATLSIACFASLAGAVTLKEAVGEALSSNPEILKSIENREAVEFELRQARGSYLPTLDLEASSGGRLLDNASRRALGTENQQLNEADVGLTFRQTLFDGGTRQSEVERSAARVDAASFRVSERSEAIALGVSQEYFEIMLQKEIVAIVRNNVNSLSQIVSDISVGVSVGTLSSADKMQGRERVLSAKARLKAAEEDLNQASIRFHRLVGVQPNALKFPPAIGKVLPHNMDEAVQIALRQNPRLNAVDAEVDAADAWTRGAKAAYLPTVAFEARARFGSDIDGSEGRTSDMNAKVVARWNLYSGGRDVANEQERIRRAGESRMDKSIAQREVYESISSAWDKRSRRGEQAAILREQVSASANLVSAYRDQFKLGQRSLLDVLSAQNNRVNTEITAKTTAYAASYADYQILAAMGSLVSALDLKAQPQSENYARTEFDVVSSEETPSYKRLPSRQESGLPMDLLAPISGN